MIAYILFALAQSAVTPAAAEDKIVCRNEFQVYSRIPERICRRKSQWEAIAKANEEALDGSRKAHGGSQDSGTMYSTSQGELIFSAPKSPR